MSHGSAVTAALALAAALVLPAGPAAAHGEPGAHPERGAERQPHDEDAERDEHDPGPVHRVLLYLPNRVFDLLDVVRARARVGPGFGVGARATELADVYLGSYTSVYAGLPGPRGKRSPPWPLGLDSHSGLEVSVVDLTADPGVGPNYSDTEVGASLHLLLVGLDVGVDPLELVDFLTGIVGVDLREDDL